MSEPLTDLGWANAWPAGTMPEIVEKCKAAGHNPGEADLGACTHQVICRECGYFYSYDSSD